MVMVLTGSGLEAMETSLERTGTTAAAAPGAPLGENCELTFRQIGAAVDRLTPARQTG